MPRKTQKIHVSLDWITLTTFTLIMEYTNLHNHCMFPNQKFLPNKAAVGLLSLLLIFPAVRRKPKYLLHFWKIYVNFYT